MESTDDKDFFNRRQSLFEHEGWPELVAEWEQLIGTNGSVEGINTTEDFWRAKGYIDALNLMVRLEELTKQTIESRDDL